MAKTANGASRITHCDDPHAGFEDLLEERHDDPARTSAVDGARLSATPKISAKTISGSISPSRARAAESIGLRGMSLDERVGQRLRRGRVRLEGLEAGLLTRRRCLERRPAPGPDDVDEQECRWRPTPCSAATVKHERPADRRRETAPPAQLEDTDHQRREDHRHDDHEDQSQKDLADRPEDVDVLTARDPCARGVRATATVPSTMPSDQGDQQTEVEFHRGQDTNIEDLKFEI